MIAAFPAVSWMPLRQSQSGDLPTEYEQRLISAEAVMIDPEVLERRFAVSPDELWQRLTKALTVVPGATLTTCRHRLRGYEVARSRGAYEGARFTS